MYSAKRRLRLFRHPAWAAGGLPTFDTLTLANGGGIDAFVTKYNDAGRINWAARLVGAGDDQSYGVSVDSLGNIYVTGYYSSSPVTVYNVDGSTFGTLTNSGSNDVFIVKYDSVGVVQWTTRLGGTGDDQGISISVDSSGNVYVIGIYMLTFTIYNADGGTFGTLVNGGITDVFIVKYNTMGVTQWATRLAGTRFDIGAGISVDSSGNVYVTGHYDSASLTIYNADGGTFGSLTGPGFNNNDVFVIKYNSAGIAQWATKIAGTSEEVVKSISVDSSGNVYVAGYYLSPTLTAFNVGGASFGSVANSGGNDGFIVKYNTSGVTQWITRLGGASSDQIFGITTDSSGNVYVTGQYASASLTIYNAGGGTFGTLTKGGLSDVFIVKYSSAGVAQWAARMSGANSEFGFGISADSTGNVYVTGQYAAAISAYNGDGSLFSGTGMPLPTAGSNDVLIFKYTPSGNVVWGTRLSGTGGDIGQAIAVSGTNIVVCGQYASNPLTLRSVGF